MVAIHPMFRLKISHRQSNIDKYGQAYLGTEVIHSRDIKAKRIKWETPAMHARVNVLGL